MGQPQQPRTDVIQPESTDTVDMETLNNIRHTQPGNEDQVGRDTVGQGQPNIQKVKNEESLPPTAVPVNKNFENTAEFYHPQEDEAATAQRDAAQRGAMKTTQVDDLENEGGNEVLTDK